VRARLWLLPAETAYALASKGLDLLGQLLLLPVAVTQSAIASKAPAPDSAVGSESEAVECSGRHSDDALASKGLDLLRQEPVLLVAVAQLAKVSTAPAPDGAVGGEGEAVPPCSRHSDDALVSQGLDLRRQQLVLLLPVAQLAVESIAPAPDSAVGGDGEAVVDSSQDSDDVPPC